ADDARPRARSLARPQARPLRDRALALQRAGAAGRHRPAAAPQALPAAASAHRGRRRVGEVGDARPGRRARLPAAQHQLRAAALHETVGGFGMLLAIAHEWRPREAWERSMTLLSREVLPLLAKGNAS